MEEFVRWMPKVELHAHLNGSVSSATINKLLQKRKAKDGLGNEADSFSMKNDGNLDDCFETFKLIHELVDDEEAVYLITCDVIKDYVEDNVKYLEIRTTPRANPATGMNKASYIESVLKGIEDSTSNQPSVDIVVKLILCIDRRHSIVDSLNTIELASSYRTKSGGTIVGIDLCGFPNAGDAREFIPVFQKALSEGFPLTLHLSEVENQNEETLAILKQCAPARIGHGTFLHPNSGGTEEIVTIVEKLNIPLELCLTSNVIVNSVSDYTNHHFDYWYKKGHPCLICTDDKGVFNTALSKEYFLAAETFGLSKEQIWEISYKSIDHIFACDSVKVALKAKWNSMKPS